MKKIALGLILLSVLLLPVATLASDISAVPTPPAIPTTLVGLGEAIVRALWVVFVVIAIIMFVVAGILFVTSQGSPEKVALARQSFIWGIAGVVVAILAYTIVSVISSGLGSVAT